jgi:hypothetical protein
MTQVYILNKQIPADYFAEVLNVKILKIMTKLCIRSDDTKKDCLLTPFSMVKQLSISKILVL